MCPRGNSELNLSERHVIQGKLTSPSSSQTESQNAEAQLRQALDHMGSPRLSLVGTQANSGRASGSLTTSRHRYVRDGEVPVVHAALGRTNSRSDPAGQQDKAQLEALRQELDRERLAREAAERALNDMRSLLTASQTRLAHLEMDLQAAQGQLAAQALAEVPEPVPVPEIIRRKPRERREPRIEKTDREPQAVKWWVKHDKA